ncbi:ABC transporter ATP-binding protein [Bacillus sp. J14TS2]|uniref:ABC transporter ATP-binding protein n=1 Tax=Bacillus sp. J14TS2 TaxID=2807188 RepID=UPI001B037EA3|nr:ATP-binding cassette domain-containing protein [Bacillus sp. J14TS2]GIN70221.1 ABC transporter ATP-binding protein [Bacillus sp. J14TS2]
MIHIEGLSKSFKVAKRSNGLGNSLKALFHREHTIVHALHDISFSIQPGEIVGYIGPNGAGKSTTIKIMSGILVPDQGSCQIMDYIPWEDRVHYVKNVGVVFGQRSQLWWDVPVIDSFELLRDIYKIPQPEYKANVALLIETLDLEKLIYTPVRQLSLGQRMRCEIAASLLHSPKILFLDEPTIGLDAHSKIAVRKFIQTINKEKGVTILLTTHDMHDIEALVDRVLLIGKGSLLYDGKLQELRKRYGGHKIVTVDYEKLTQPITITGATLLSQKIEQAIFSLDAEKTNISQFISKLSEQVNILDISIKEQPIEDLIVQLYEEYQL